MDFFLNRVDPQLVKSVKEVTSSSIVHKKDEVEIQDEDGSREREKRERKKSNDEIKEKVEELNQLSEENVLDIFFVVEEENNQLLIKVFNKKLNVCIRSFDESEIEEILDRLQDLSGIILDTKI